MKQIRNLFDPTRALNRPIEKVITYQRRNEAQLQAEISEYVVTEHIEESFSDLLKKMQAAMQGGDGHEIGVWVSGFYGSGKSSFTKYLGFSLDRGMKVADETFLHLLQNQLKTAAVRALFSQRGMRKGDWPSVGSGREQTTGLRQSCVSSTGMSASTCPTGLPVRSTVR